MKRKEQIEALRQAYKIVEKTLTNQEIKLLDCAKDNLSVKETSKKTGVSKENVKTEIERVQSKVRVEVYKILGI